MARAAPNQFQVQVRAGARGKSLEKIFDELRLEVTDAPGADRRFHHQVRPPAEVYGGHRQGLIHGHDEISGAVDAAFRAQRLEERLAEGDPDVFYGVVLVHIQIAARSELEIETAVPCEEFQHVVEEADAGRDAVSPAPVEREPDVNVCFGGLAANGRSARSHANHPVGE